MGYGKTSKLFDELRRISKEYGVVIMTAQQPQREFYGYSREIRLSPHTGKSRNLGFFTIDHINLIKTK